MKHISTSKIHIPNHGGKSLNHGGKSLDHRGKHCIIEKSNSKIVF